MSNVKSFWRDYLKGFNVPTPLGYRQACRSVCAEKGSRGRLEVRMSPETTQALKLLLKEESFGPDLLLQGAWAILLSRYSGNRDVVYGVENLYRKTGFVPLRIEVPPEMQLSLWLRQLGSQYRLLMDNADIPLEDIVGFCDMPENTAIFDSVVLANHKGLHDASRIPNPSTEKYPFVLCSSNGNVLGIKAEFSREIMNDRAADTILGHLATVLAQMSGQPELKIGEIPILTPSENRLLQEWNGTEVPLPHETTIAGMFRVQAERTPDQVAAVFEDQQITYRELDVRADRMARQLRGMGVGPEVMVAICMERSLELLVGLLGILKAGGAYVPLDPSFPAERLAFMLSDSGAPVLLMDRKFANLLPDSGAGILYPDELENWGAGDPDKAAENGLRPDNLAYVIYTSGSTGKPKGVMVEQRNVVNFFAGMDRVVDYGPGDALLAVTSLSFDISVLELLWTLVRGFKVVICPDGAANGSESKESAGSIPNLVRDHHVTHIQCTPTMAGIFMMDNGIRNVLPRLKQILIGGEAFPVSLADSLREITSGTVINMYGPTETTVWSTTHRLEKSLPKVPIGRPIANTTVLVVDKNLQPVPVGIPGELIIGGNGVVRGYLNRPELTAERFIDGPIGGTWKGRFYRTGDLAKFLPDGNLEFLGRMDHQVKIRGYRIELGEIETLLHECPEIHSAVVIVREDVPGHRTLVAYVILKEGRTFSQTGAQDYLSQRLPDYMVPAHFVVLEEFPQTPNKKTDRNALPPPETCMSRKEIAADPPVTDMEKAIAVIWEEALNVRGIGRKDSFFEMGGDSLLACSVTLNIEEAIGTELPLDTIFNAPTVEALAKRLETLFLEQNRNEAEEVDGKGGLSESRPVSGLSADEVESALAGIWAKVLNIETVGREDSFFQMGGDSLKAVSLVMDIEKAFGTKLPISTLIQAPTVKELTRVLCEEKADSHWSPLVPIQPLGDKLPFFCVHGHRGNVMNYSALSQYLGTDQPFYGLQARGLDGSKIGFRTFEDMAADYVAEIRSVQPSGPYRLGGWCMGGYIALEMARILQSEGERVSLLALIDSPHPDWPEFLPGVTGVHKMIYKIAERVHYEVRSYLGVKGKERSYYTRRKRKAMADLIRLGAEKMAGSILSRVNRDFQYSVQYNLQHLYRIHDKAFRSYKPRSYNGPVAIFHPSIKPIGTVKDPKLGWGNLLEGAVDLCGIQGHWINILAEPGVRMLARELENRLS